MMALQGAEASHDEGGGAREVGKIKPSNCRVPNPLAVCASDHWDLTRVSDVQGRDDRNL